jgi:hypothetical protein
MLVNDNLKPLYCLETSPLNYQAVLRFKAEILNKDEYLAINRDLAKKYAADLASVGTEHFFRLAGFTNRKLKYRNDNGLYPFVKLFKYGNIITSLPTVLTLPTLPTAPMITSSAAGEKKTTVGDCFSYIKKVYETSTNSDLSTVDFKAVLYASRKGFFAEDIKSAILKYSPNLENRKKNHIQDYLDRTIYKALARQ